MVGDMQYSWRKLKKQSVDVAENLATLQVSSWHAVLCCRVRSLGSLMKMIGCTAAGWIQAHPAARCQAVCDGCAGLPARLGCQRAHSAWPGPHGCHRAPAQVPAALRGTVAAADWPAAAGKHRAYTVCLFPMPVSHHTLLWNCRSASASGTATRLARSCLACPSLSSLSWSAPRRRSTSLTSCTGAERCDCLQGRACSCTVAH